MRQQLFISGMVIALIAASVFLIDQCTKIWAMQHAQVGIPLIGSWFQLIVFQNTGIAFSIALHPRAILVLSYLFLGAGIVFSLKDVNIRKLNSRILLGITIGGALGNLVDRMIHGYVIDFIAIGSYPVFNIADIAVVTGLLGIVVFYNTIKIYGAGKGNT